MSIANFLRLSILPSLHLPRRNSSDAVDPSNFRHLVEHRSMLNGSGRGRRRGPAAAYRWVRARVVPWGKGAALEGPGAAEMSMGKGGGLSVGRGGGCRRVKAAVSVMTGSTRTSGHRA